MTTTPQPTFTTGAAPLSLPLWQRPSLVLPALVMALLVAVPVVALATGESFYVALFARLVIYAVAASALNLSLGFGGLIGFGHALFIGLGAYSVSMLSYNGIGNGWLHLGTAVAGCAAAGLLSGIISLRTKGIAFIMITLAFSQIGYFVFVSLKQYGGDDGMPIDKTSRFGGIDLGSAMAAYLVALAVLALVILWVSRLRVAPFGMVLRAGRQNSRRVDAIGLPLMHYQLLAYVMSACICGVAGLLLANLNAFASPGLMSWQVSGELIVMVILGGMGYAFGPLMGAIVFIGLDEVMKRYTEHWMAFFGPLLVVMSIAGKAGVMGLLVKLDRLIADRRAGSATATGDVPATTPSTRPAEARHMRPPKLQPEVE